MRTKMTHGFPALDGPTTAENYAKSVRADATFSVFNLKREAVEIETRLKYYNDDVRTLLERLIAAVDEVPEPSCTCEEY